jgi:PAS domain-containing protein
MLRLLDRLSLGCALYSPKTGVFAADHAFAEILGRRPEDILGIDLRDVTHPEDADANAWLLEGALKTGGSFALRKRYRLPCGEDRWVQNRYAVFKLGDEDAIVSLQSRPIDPPRVQPAPDPATLAGIPDYARQMIEELARLCASAGMTATAELLTMAHQVVQDELLDRASAA